MRTFDRESNDLRAWIGDARPRRPHGRGDPRRRGRHAGDRHAARPAPGAAGLRRGAALGSPWRRVLPPLCGGDRGRRGGPALAAMQGLNPARGGGVRARGYLCRSQTLLCRALALRVPEWNVRPFDHSFHLVETGYRPPALVQAPRLGIPPGRDEHLCYRFVDSARAPRHRQPADALRPAVHGLAWPRAQIRWPRSGGRLTAPQVRSS